MSPRKSLSLVVTSSLLFAILGGLLGAGVASFFPEYYEAVVRGGNSEEFRPLPVAIGLGVTQGAGAGIAIGLALVCLHLHKEAEQPADDVVPRQPNRVTGYLRAFAFLMGFGLCTFVAYLAGGIVGQLQLYSRMNAIQLERVNDVLAAGEYPNIEAASSKRYVSLVGSVSNDDTLNELELKLVQQFGKDESRRMIQGINVAP